MNHEKELKEEQVKKDKHSLLNRINDIKDVKDIYEQRHLLVLLQSTGQSFSKSEIKVILKTEKAWLDFIAQITQEIKEKFETKSSDFQKTMFKNLMTEFFNVIKEITENKKDFEEITAAFKRAEKMNDKKLRKKNSQPGI